MKRSIRPPSPPAGKYASVPFLGSTYVEKGPYGKPVYRFAFGSIEVGGKPYEAAQHVGTDDRGGSGLHEVLESLFGRSLPYGETVDDSDLVGQEYDLVIAPSENGTGTVLASFAPSAK